MAVDMAADMANEAGGGRKINAPLSPGLFAQVGVRDHRRIEFDEAVVFNGAGVLALDGDRDHKLSDGASATVRVRRDGPWVPNLARVMRYAADAGIMAAQTARS